jgi:DNA adenine methylase
MKSSVIKWHGGKTYLAPWIVSYFPPHVHYVEAYFGGGAVLFRKPFDNSSEVVNDLNGELTNFWDVLRCPDRFESLQRMLVATPFSEVVYQRAVAMNGGTDVQRAWSFFVQYRQSRQGLGNDFATLVRNRTRRRMNDNVSAYWSAIEGLPEAHERLKRVVILNRQAIDVITSQDGPNTLFYLDPPYLHETRTTTADYSHEMTPTDHAELLDCLTRIRGKFLLSGYPSKLYAEAEQQNGWLRHEKVIDNKSSGSKTKERKVECLWTNAIV